MAASAKPSIAVSPAAELYSRLSERASLINLIHEGLRGTLDMKELSRLCIAALLTRRALGFSRALVLSLNETQTAFEAQAAVGLADRAAHDALQAEIDREREDLEAEAARVAQIDVGRQQEHAILSPSPSDPHHKEFWARVYAEFEQRDVLGAKLGRVSIPFDLAKYHSSSGGELLASLLRCGRCQEVSRRQLEASPAIPGALAEALPETSLWAGIRTNQGPKLILIADKLFEDDPIDAIDKLHMNWFCSQVALAAENADLFSDLRRTNESLRELDTLKSNFLSTISHELRTPLTAIGGFARLLVDNKVGPLTVGQREILDRIMAHAERLANTVNDLIEIAEIDSGSAISFDIRAVDPVNVLMETLPKLEPRRASKKVTLDPVLTGPVPKIRADEMGLARIFYHLLDNAIKFSRDGGRVRVEFEPIGKELAVRIVDQGIGIAPERVRQIFEAFYQVHGHLARDYEGMGIGLTLTKKLVAGTGGRLTVVSKPGEGSTFTVIFPQMRS